MGPSIRSVFTLAALSVLTVSCGTPPPASQFPDADAALGRMRACYDCTVGVQGEAKVDYFSTERGSIKGTVLLFAVNPESVRFDLTSPFGVNIYTLTSDGKNFKMADLREKVFLFGPAKPCNLARFTQVPIPGHALVSLLRGEAPVLVHDKPSTQIEWDSDGFYRLLIGSKHQAEQEIHIEVVEEDFAKPWQQQRVRVTHVGVKQGGADLYEADLADHFRSKTAPPRVDEEGVDPDIMPSGPVCDAEIPRKIRMRVPHTDDDVLFTYTEALWNPPLPEGAFDQPVPGGVRKQFVDCEK